MNELASILAKEFEDKEYAHGYVQEHLVEKIAAQVYSLRTQRGMTQMDLACASGIPQGKLSMIESGDFESLALKSLFKLAQAFDVTVDVRLRSFCEAINDVTELDLASLKVPARTDDLHARANVMHLVNNPMFDRATVAHGIAHQPKASLTQSAPSGNVESFTAQLS